MMAPSKDPPNRLNQKNRQIGGFFLVPRAGLEPARYHYRGILSPMRLPISPPGRWVWADLEAWVGIEPAYTALQAAA
jgi:hypothetical protein